MANLDARSTGLFILLLQIGLHSHQYFLFLNFVTTEVLDHGTLLGALLSEAGEHLLRKIDDVLFKTLKHFDG